jgi:hypothetical protein
MRFCPCFIQITRARKPHAGRAPLTPPPPRPRHPAPPQPPFASAPPAPALAPRVSLARAQPRHVNSPRDVNFSPRQRRGACCPITKRCGLGFACSREPPHRNGALPCKGDARGWGCTSPFSMESAVDERHQFWIAAGDICGGPKSQELVHMSQNSIECPTAVAVRVCDGGVDALAVVVRWLCCGGQRLHSQINSNQTAPSARGPTLERISRRRAWSPIFSGPPAAG